MKLKERVCLVTGGLRGIGLATARRLVGEGGVVVIADLDADDSATAMETAADLGVARYHSMDATDEAAWLRLAQDIRFEFGRLDVLVNNVGGGATKKIADTSLADWHALINLNLTTTFLGVRHMQALLADGGRQTPAGSSIINVSSIMGLISLSESSVYSAAKGGVRLLTKSAALEFAENGIPIRVNSVHPGFIDTPLLRESLTLWAERQNSTLQKLIDDLVSTTPMRRLAAPEEIGNVIAFLASDDASYMTGSEVVIDGGYTAR